MKIIHIMILKCLSNVVFKIMKLFLFFSFITTIVNGQIPPDLCYCGSLIDSRYFIINHYHKIDGHHDFRDRNHLNTVCSTTEFAGKIKVASDGAVASVIEMTGQFENSCNYILNLDFVITDEFGNAVGNSNPNTYGEFILINQNGPKHTFKFKHPTLTPLDGEQSGIMHVRIINTLNNDIISSLQVEYYRPPVVMIHGLWSSLAAFVDMKDHLVSSGNYTIDQVFNADYSTKNDRSFSTNFLVPPLSIVQCISDMRSVDIAVGKVDVVCHSMGGVLMRNYLSNPLYELNNDIRRVITCNTPHAGSQMANFLLDTLNYGKEVAFVLNNMGKNCYGGAVSDLRAGTVFINSVAYGDILGDAQVHAIRTVADIPNIIFSSAVTYVNYTTLIIALTVNQCGSVFVEDVFDSPDHDLIVAAESQDGGLTGLHLTEISDQIHMESVANPNVMDRVKELLNYPNVTPYFANSYWGFSLNYNLNLSCFFKDDIKVYSRTVPDINITSPIGGTNINSDTTININYSSTMIENVLAIVEFHPDSVAVIADTTVAGMIQFPVPSGVYGFKPLVLLGLDGNNRILDIDTVMINFTTNATLDSISVSPDNFYLNQNDSLAFTVSGHYSDGIIRNITQDSDLIFDFEHDFASRYNQSYIKMDSLNNDTLFISKDSIISDKILINKVGTNYPPNCHLVTNTNNNGVGSLKFALECVAPNDTILFDPQIVGDTIFIDSISLDIEKSLNIINTNVGKIIIKSGFYTVINIFSGTDIRLENLLLISSNPSHVCINNYGDLSLKDVECRTLGQDKAAILNEQNGTIEIIGSNVLK